MSKKNQNMLITGGVILIVIVFIYIFSSKNTETFLPKCPARQVILSNGKCGSCPINEGILTNGKCGTCPGPRKANKRLYIYANGIKEDGRCGICNFYTDVLENGKCGSIGKN